MWGGAGVGNGSVGSGCSCQVWRWLTFSYAAMPPCAPLHPDPTKQPLSPSPLRAVVRPASYLFYRSAGAQPRPCSLSPRLRGTACLSPPEEPPPLR